MAEYIAKCPMCGLAHKTKCPFSHASVPRGGTPVKDRTGQAWRQPDEPLVTKEAAEQLQKEFDR